MDQNTAWECSTVAGVTQVLALFRGSSSVLAVCPLTSSSPSPSLSAVGSYCSAPSVLPVYPQLGWIGKKSFPI